MLRPLNPHADISPEGKARRDRQRRRGRSLRLAALEFAMAGLAGTLLMYLCEPSTVRLQGAAVASFIVGTCFIGQLHKPVVSVARRLARTH